MQVKTSTLVLLSFCLFPFFANNIFAQSTSHSCLTVAFANAAGLPGDTVCVDVSVQDFKKMIGAQFSMLYNTQKLEFVQLTNFNLEGARAESFGLPTNPNIGAGKVTFAWSDPTLEEAETLEDGVTLFSVCFKIIGTLGDTTTLNFSKKPTPIEFYNEESFYNNISLPYTLLPGTITFQNLASTLAVTSSCVNSSTCNDFNNGNIELVATGGKAPYTFQWQGSNGFRSTQEDLDSLYTGQYFVTVTDSDQDTVVGGPFLVGAPPKFVSLSAPDTLLCAGDTITLQANTTVTSTYEWSSKANKIQFSCNNCANPKATVTPNLGGGIQTDTCVVIATSVNGCKDTSEVVLQIRAYKAVLDTVLLVCTGDSLVLNKNNSLPSGNYVWQGPNNFSSTSQSPILPSAQAGTYTLNYTDAVGCSFQTDLTVTINPLPVITEVIKTDSVCESATTGRIALLLPKTPGGYTINWSNGIQGNADTIATLEGLTAGLYSVGVTNTFGCTSTDTFFIANYPKIQAEVVTTPSCGSPNGGSATVNITQGKAPFRFQWTNGDTTAALSNLAPGIQFVNVQDGNGCNNSVEVKVSGTAITNITKNVKIFDNNGVQIFLEALNAQNINWSPSQEVNDNNSFSPIVKPTSTITYFVATVSDGQGCTVKDSVLAVKFPLQPAQPGFLTVEHSDTLEWCSILSQSADPIGYEITRVLSFDAERLIQTEIVPGTACLNYYSKPFAQGADTLLIEICKRNGGPCQVFEALVTALQVLVFPGDTNDDGIVNNYDLLNLGIGNGTNGPSRAGNPALWAGFSAQLWQQYTPVSNVNYAHIDADGNGQINPSDTIVIQRFWNNTHNYAGLQTPVISPRNAGAPLYIDADTLVSGQTMRLPIVLGDAANPAQNTYGAAFTIVYNPAVIDTASVFVEFGDSWLGKRNQDYLALYRNFGKTGKVEVGLARLNQQNVSGAGIIGYLNLKVKAGMAGTPNVRFNIEQPKLISVDEQALPVTPIATAVNVTTRTYDQWLNSQIQIFPNPASEMLFIQTNDLNIEQVEIFNASGQLLQLYGKVAQLSVAAFPAGVYLLRVITDKGVVSKRVVVK